MTMAAAFLTWWIWMSAGLVLAIIEVIVPGYIFLGFSIGAILVGLLLLVGLTLGVSGLILLFAVLSLIAFVLLRRFMGVRHGQVRIWDRDIND